MLAKLKDLQRTIKPINRGVTEMISSPISKSQFEDSIRFVNVSHEEYSSLEYMLVP